MSGLSQLSQLGFETADVVVFKEKGKPGEDKYRPEQKLRVRGLGLEDLMKLLRVHGPGMVTIFNQTVQAVRLAEATAESVEAKLNIDPLDAVRIFQIAFEQAPDLVADLIVLASDSDTPVEDVKKARKLPLPVQLKLLQEIFRLTLEEHGGLGELMETVMMLLGGANGLLKNLTALQAGSLQSAAQSAS